ncbi:MAG TPA: polyprenyl synthetase family protein, partial [Myxococcales bacterium]|nr:polyprenyl synthetase family protein [Myxococcales bacterium]
MAAVTSAGLSDLVEAAARAEARPSAAQLLPVTAAAEGLLHLERLLLSAARAGPRDLGPAAEALVRSGGKRVRPLLTLLAARAAAPGRRSRGRVALAVVAELVHSATLLHDDVIDDGLTRRGMPAPRVAYGNGVSVL